MKYVTQTLKIQFVLHLLQEESLMKLLVHLVLVVKETCLLVVKVDFGEIKNKQNNLKTNKTITASL